MTSGVMLPATRMGLPSVLVCMAHFRLLMVVEVSTVQGLPCTVMLISLSVKGKEDGLVIVRARSDPYWLKAVTSNQLLKVYSQEPLQTDGTPLVVTFTPG